MENYINNNNFTPDEVYELIVRSKTFNLCLYDMDITRFNKLIDFVGNNIEPCMKYNVFIDYGLCINFNKFTFNNIYDRKEIAKFYCEIMNYIIIKDIMVKTNNMKIHFYKLY